MATYDVFLSYASVDNTVLAKPWNDQRKWVSCFKVALQQALDSELGRTGSAEWFIDAKVLRTGEFFSDKLRNALNNTKLFVALASPGYFHKDAWCKIEREYFISTLGDDPRRAQRIYAVLLHEEMRSVWEKECFAGGT